ncbi:hypothetical protein MUO14_07745 [Halobacillus shinanisalinarum]|uniref:Uncharacterized protein n=1 Tax=Halobacillus shinanisalinarum TaxID=2932258 RepID=A0ABY4H2Y0_9BACI|nr:hypothetical protein [Halobacillus shinanisalinarum]UOQ94813.1 hypothetical protein MUO14_07745 [Halobacillus shinanisalinarum]
MLASQNNHSYTSLSLKDKLLHLLMDLVYCDRRCSSIVVLIINGERDLQVTVQEAKELHEAKAEAKLLVMDKMNHVFKEASEDRKGNVETYFNSDLPLADGLV